MAAYTIVVSFGDGSSANLSFTSGSLTLSVSNIYNISNTYTISALLSGASASSTPATQIIVVLGKHIKILHFAFWVAILCIKKEFLARINIL